MGACGVCMCGVGECRRGEGGGGSIVAKFYLIGNVTKIWCTVHLFQMFLSMRYTVL